MTPTKSIAALALFGLLFACNPVPDRDPAISDNTTDAHREDAVSSDVPRSDETIAALSEDERIAAMQQRLRDRQATDAATPDSPAGSAQNRYRLDIPPYNSFADAQGYLNFTDVTLNMVQQRLGEAPIQVRMSRPGAPLRREVRVYLPYEEDATGLYLFFRNEVVVDFKMDEFNGLQNPAIAEFFGY